MKQYIEPPWDQIEEFYTKRQKTTYKRFNFMLPQWMADNLKDVANRNNISSSQLLRNILTKHLEKDE